MSNAIQERSRKQEGLSALTITAIYLLAGGLWIFFSDGLLHALVSDSTLLMKLQTFKGWFYVIATGLMLFVLIRRSTMAVRNSNAALRRNEEDLQKILNMIPALVFVTDPDDHLLRFNSVFARATGLPPNQIVGKTCTELFLLADPEAHRQNDIEIIQTGKPKLNMIERIESDEGAKWFDVSKMPFLDKDGKAQSILGFAVNITEQRLAAEAVQESQRQLQSILDNAPSAIYVKDLEGRFQLVNRSLELMLKMPKEHILGKTDYDVFPPELSDVYRQNDQEVIETGSPVEREEVVRQGDVEHTLISVKFPLADSSGVPYALCGISTDITERKRMEEALRESQQLLQLVLATLPVGVVVMDQAGDIVLMNAASKRIWDERPMVSARQRWAQASGFWHNSGERIAPTDWASVRALSEGQRTLNQLIDIETYDGRQKTIENSAAPIRNAEEQIVGAVVVNEDVTERVRAEEALRKSENLWRTTFDNAAIGIAIVNSEGRPVETNPAFQKILGYTKEELRHQWFVDFTHPDDTIKEFPLHQEMIDGKRDHYQMEKRFIRKDGQVRWVNLIASVIPAEQPGEFFGVGMVEDITERKQAEAAMEDRERRLNLVYQNVADCIFILSVEPDERYRFVSVNEAFLTVTGFRREQVVDKCIEEVLPETSHELVKGKYLEAIEHNKTVRWEEVAVMPAGRRIGEAFVTPVRDEVMDRLYLLGGVHDVTERIEGEEALRESETKFRMLAESSASAILYHLDDGTLAYVNPAAVRMTGYSRDELLKLKIWDLLHPDFRTVVEERLRARQAGEPVVSQNEVRMIVKGGETRWINYTAGRMEIEGNNAMIAMVTDVTERKRAEEELRASHEQLRALAARLESVREEEGTRIAREIHDELGSALTGLKWDLERVNKALAETRSASALPEARGKIRGMLGTIDNTINTVRRISSELRPGVLDDLGLVAAIEWQARQFQERTGILCQFAAGVEEANLDRQASTAIFRMFQEILTNILRHAQAGKVWINAYEKEDHFVLEVRDDGRGISEAEKYNSHSLGLLGMRERGHLIGGRIEIGGVKGEGTTVIVRVPLAAVVNSASPVN